jgi:endonuclease/exonuclease/phosphatase family metal-dependent hydrolase
MHHFATVVIATWLRRVAAHRVFACLTRGRGLALVGQPMAGNAARRSPSNESTASSAVTAQSGDYGEEAHVVTYPDDVAGAAVAAPVTTGTPTANAAPAVAGHAVRGTSAQSVAVGTIGGPAVAGPPSGDAGTGDGGCIGVYQGNWGGNKKNPQLQRHLVQDVVLQNVCQVLCAQEVDPNFVTVLRQGGEKPHGEMEESRLEPGRRWVRSSWLVVTGREDGKTNIVAAKPEHFKEVKLVEWHKSNDGQYRARGTGTRRMCTAFSRVLVAELVFNRRWHGRDSIKVMSVHMHHQTAKKTSQSQHTRQFWNGLAHVIQRHRPELMCGDFNMSLFAVPEGLRTRTPTLLAC